MQLDSGNLFNDEFTDSLFNFPDSSGDDKKKNKSFNKKIAKRNKKTAEV